ncbi:hypothetical protein L7F22_044128 [Adiantum nelumboides]|nr:hypothetical protein [Adiantum nelumboides]
MSGSTLPFYQVDVFSSEPYKGNPVAVTIIEDEKVAERLKDGEHMARFARWTNLSETTFILPVTKEDEPEVDYNLRIFTPGIELPFAGHPTLGSCRAWLEHGGKPKKAGVVVQKCGLGLIYIRISDDEKLLSFSTPPLRKSGPATKQEILPFLKAMNLNEDDILESQWIVNGPEWCALRLRDANAVLNVKVSDPNAAGKGIWGVFGSYKPGEHPDGATFEVRTFAPGDNIPEDPVTGSFR